MSNLASADTLRIATYAAPLSRDGPGLLLRDILQSDDPGITAISNVIGKTEPDILVLTDFDFDTEAAALSAFNDSLAAPFDHLFSRIPNSGMATGLDLDGDGRLGDARDGQGYGRFAGDGGTAVLSRYPIKMTADYSDLLWRDLDGATLPMMDGSPFPSADAIAVQRLSSTVHWHLSVELPDGLIDLLVFNATPPVFDGPQDRNGLRNRDELRLWSVLLDGGFGTIPDKFVVVGNANLDPADGAGIKGAMADFLARPDIYDPQPSSAGGLAAADAGHLGDPALDTADWEGDIPGNLRVSYILPSRTLQVVDAGVFWPDPSDPDATILGSDSLAAGPHRLVWVDIKM